MNNYIFLNGGIYEVTERSIDEYWVGGNFERTLSGRGTLDRTIMKADWSFNFHLDNDLQLARLRSIYASNAEITFIDCDAISHTIVITSNFKPVYQKNGGWIVTLDFKEV